MKLLLRWHDNRDAFSFLELLCSLAILGMIGLSLVALQHVLINSALIAIEDNMREQYLYAVQSRLLLALPGSNKVTILPKSINTPMTLVVEQELRDGLKIRSYYKSLNGTEFYETGEWRNWKGAGTQPGKYTTPIASEITHFSAEIIATEQGHMLRLFFSSHNMHKELTIWLRNIRN